MINCVRSDNKKKGILLPIFSLPSPYGIGCFSQEARDFVDWLAETGHSYWQILPLHPVGCADSPYQPLSSFAGNPYFIDPVQLQAQGLLTAEELAGFDFGSDPGQVNYDALHEGRMRMLRIAYGRFTTAEKAYRQFLRDNASWLEDYALFMTLRETFGREDSWVSWPQPLRHRETAALDEVRAKQAETIDFHRWIQYEFDRQWAALKAYANAAGVQIIGDMPVYVSYDSSDCWANPDQFQLDEDLLPARIAGVPPDDFAAEGQLWGNPLYDWERMRGDGYRWWQARIRRSFQLYDVLRLDHFRGYEAYYSCAADAENALGGVWQPGPGMDLFQRLDEATPVAQRKLPKADVREEAQAPRSEGASAPLRFIAEDLGHLTEGVEQLLAATGFPGTKVLQFAFDGDPANPYLPENFGDNCVVYTGTHDNDTTAGWFRKLDQTARAGILQYLGYTGEEAWWFVLESDAAMKRGEPLGEPRDVRPAQSAQPRRIECAPGPDGRIPDPALIAADGLMRKALESRAKLAIIPLQDYLHLGSAARVNTPGTIIGNWSWRIRA